MDLNQFIINISEVTALITLNSDSFEEQFCAGNWMIDIAFGTMTVHIWYVDAVEGIHIKNQIKYSELAEWLGKIQQSK